jgi:hypothetical protein
LVPTIEDAQKNGVDITGLNTLVLAEVDAANQPGIYSISLTDAILAGAGVTAVAGDIIEMYLDAPGGASAPAVFKFVVREKINEDLSTELAAVDAKIDIIDTNVDDIETLLNDGTNGLAAIKTAIDTVDGVVDGNATALNDIQGAGFATGTDSLEAISERVFPGGTVI